MDSSYIFLSNEYLNCKRLLLLNSVEFLQFQLFYFLQLLNINEFGRSSSTRLHWPLLRITKYIKINEKKNTQINIDTQISIFWL